MTERSDEETVVKYGYSAFVSGVAAMSMEPTEHCLESKNAGWNVSVPAVQRALLDP